MAILRDDVHLLTQGIVWGRCWVCALGQMVYDMQPDCLECDNCGHREGVY